jgi:N-acetylglucosamine malate deacetylase 2
MPLDISFSETMETCRRPLLFLAHQDDELGCTGILQRLHDRLRVVFMTNGDGLAPSVDENPVRYAALRKEEALLSLETAGVAADQTRFLGFSEIEIYRNMAKLKQAPLRLSEVIAFFEPIRRSIAEAVYEFRPDAVFTVAYQGGHPEHDLVHYFTALALRSLEQDAETRIPLYHFPEYELTILLPMRFRPWFPGQKEWVELTRGEAEIKNRMADCYASQRSLVRNFRRVVGFLTLPQRLLKTENPVDRFFSREQITRVTSDFDYRHPPYRIDFFNYMFDDFQGVPITFMDCIRPLVVAFEDDFGKRM